MSSHLFLELLEIICHKSMAVIENTTSNLILWTSIVLFITVQWKQTNPTYVHSYKAELLRVVHGIYMAEVFILHLVVWESGKNEQHYVGQLQCNLTVYIKPSQFWAIRRNIEAVSLAYIYFHKVWWVWGKKNKHMHKKTRERASKPSK